MAWASSKITTSGSGRISTPAREVRMARSAKNRWWFTSTTSASAASARARVTKHSSKRSHSRPVQLSLVAERSFQVW